MKIKKNIALSDTGFIFNTSTGESFSLNPIGLEIVKMVRDEKEYEWIKSKILEKYQTDEATFDRDFYDFEKMMMHYSLSEDHD